MTGALLAAACGSSASPSATIQPSAATLGLSVPDFKSGRVPVADTCDGGDHAPVMTWGPLPNGTEEVFVDFFDPDAGNFSHWLVFAIPAAALGIPPLPGGARQGRNGFGHPGYGGPCPPHGSTHHYQVRVVALADPLGLAEGATRAELYRALEGKHELAAATLTATYGR